MGRGACLSEACGPLWLLQAELCPPAFLGGSQAPSASEWGVSGDRAFKGGIKLNEIYGWTLVEALWCPRKKRTLGHTDAGEPAHRRPREDTRDGSHLHAKERGLRETVNLSTPRS